MVTLALIVLTVLCLLLIGWGASLTEELRYARRQRDQWRMQCKELHEASDRDHMRHAEDIRLVCEIKQTVTKTLAN